MQRYFAYFVDYFGFLLESLDGKWQKFLNITIGIEGRTCNFEVTINQYHEKVRRYY